MPEVNTLISPEKFYTLMHIHSFFVLFFFPNFRSRNGKINTFISSHYNTYLPARQVVDSNMWKTINLTGNYVQSMGSFPNYLKDYFVWIKVHEIHSQVCSLRKEIPFYSSVVRNIIWMRNWSMKCRMTYSHTSSIIVLVCIFPLLVYKY